MKRIEIGRLADVVTAGHSYRQPLTLGIDSLIESKLLIQANSGGGKSNAIRLLAEKLAPTLPFIIIDPEGEFATLREKVDLVLVGEGGELAASPKNAGELAIKLLTLGVSAVIDLYNLVPAERREWVARYCENIIAAPKRLWRPFVLFVDEAQVFCPEKTDSVAHGPLIQVMTLSRKRQMCPILVTPRLASLSTDARAPINNFLIGRATLDVDYKRAGEILGMPTQDRRSLASLKKGEFHAFGPSFGHDGVEFSKLDMAETRPAKTGKATTAIPAPSAVIKAVVPELEALALPSNPDDVVTIDAAKKRIAELKKELRQKPAATTAAVAVDTNAIERAVKQAVQKRDEFWEPEVNRLAKAVKDREARLNKIAEHAHLNGEAIVVKKPFPLATVSIDVRPVCSVGSSRPSSPTPQRPIGEAGDTSLGKCERSILQVLSNHPEGCQKGKLSLLAGYAYSGGFRNSLSTLRTAGLIEGGNEELMKITSAGERCGPFEEMPNGAELRAYWLNNRLFGKCEQAILRALFDAYPNGIAGEEVGQYTDPPYEYSGGLRNSLSTLRTAGLIVGKNTETIKASDHLFDA